jgi:hypothetical protein
MELDPKDRSIAFQLGPVLAELGDLPAYQEFCKTTLSRSGGLTDPGDVERMFRPCLLLPGSFADPEQLAPLLHTALADDQTKPFYGFILLAEGLHHYRCGRFAEALSPCRKSAERLPGYRPLPIMCRYVEAMSFHQLGKTEDARKTMSEANRLLDQASKVDADDGRWWDWLCCRILRREAEALIQPATAKTPKP